MMQLLVRYNGTVMAPETSTSPLAQRDDAVVRELWSELPVRARCQMGRALRINADGCDAGRSRIALCIVQTVAAIDIAVEHVLARHQHRLSQTAA